MTVRRVTEIRDHPAGGSVLIVLGPGGGRDVVHVSARPAPSYRDRTPGGTALAVAVHCQGGCLVGGTLLSRTKDGPVRTPVPVAVALACIRDGVHATLCTVARTDLPHVRSASPPR
ncbi:hypothetical protein GCM10027194_05090 [Thalassiella azotivora]